MSENNSIVRHTKQQTFSAVNIAVRRKIESIGSDEKTGEAKNLVKLFYRTFLEERPDGRYEISRETAVVLKVCKLTRYEEWIKAVVDAEMIVQNEDHTYFPGPLIIDSFQIEWASRRSGVKPTNRERAQLVHNKHFPDYQLDLYSYSPSDAKLHYFEKTSDILLVLQMNGLHFDVRLYFGSEPRIGTKISQVRVDYSNLKSIARWFQSDSPRTIESFFGIPHINPIVWDIQSNDRDTLMRLFDQRELAHKNVVLVEFDYIEL